MNSTQKITVNNCQYIWDNEKSEFRMGKDDLIPEYFTKYYALSKYNVEALTKNYIYASHPFELNDPFDCYYKLIDTSLLTKIDIDNFLRIIPISISSNIKNTIDLVKYPEKLIDVIYNVYFNGCGIISLTDSENENPNLWANYTKNHKGFSITYNGENIKEISLGGGPFKINYFSKLEKVVLKDLSKICPLLLYLITTKSDYWSNENEWRFLGKGKDNMYLPYKDLDSEKDIKKENRKLQLPENTIKNITLGYYFFDFEKRINSPTPNVIDLNKEEDSALKIELINHVQKNKIPLSKLYINGGEFKFNAFEVEYEFNKKTNIFKWKDPFT
jgi:hypothetical protein